MSRHGATVTRSAHRDEPRGQALVEFALVIPIFLLLLFGIIEGGRFVFFYEMLSNATREGARYAIVHGSNSACPSGPLPGDLVNTCDPLGRNVKNAVRDAAVSLVDTGDLFVSEPQWCVAGSSPPKRGYVCEGTNARGNYVTVFVDYSYSPVIPVLPSITISVESTLVINN